MEINKSTVTAVATTAMYAAMTLAWCATFYAFLQLQTAGIERNFAVEKHHEIDIKMIELEKENDILRTKNIQCSVDLQRLESK